MRALATCGIALGLIAIVFAAPALVTATRDGSGDAWAAPSLSRVAEPAQAKESTPPHVLVSHPTRDGDHEGFITRTFDLAIADPRALIASPGLQNCIVVSMNGTSPTQLTGGAIRLDPRTIASGHTVEMAFVTMDVNTVTPGTLPMSAYTPGALVAKHHSVQIIVRPPSADASPWVGTLSATVGFEYNGHEPKVDADGC